MNWQPMETVPRDESLVLICVPGSTDHFYLVRWRYPEEARPGDGATPGWRCEVNSSIDDDLEVITDNVMSMCHLSPMWCRVTHPPTSLCAGQPA